MATAPAQSPAARLAHRLAAGLAQHGDAIEFWSAAPHEVAIACGACGKVREYSAISAPPHQALVPAERLAALALAFSPRHLKRSAPTAVAAALSVAVHRIVCTCGADYRPRVADLLFAMASRLGPPVLPEGPYRPQAARCVRIELGVDVG